MWSSTWNPGCYLSCSLKFHVRDFRTIYFSSYRNHGIMRWIWVEPSLVCFEGRGFGLCRHILLKLGIYPAGARARGERGSSLAAQSSARLFGLTCCVAGASNAACPGETLWGNVTGSNMEFNLAPKHVYFFEICVNEKVLENKYVFDP